MPIPLYQVDAFTSRPFAGNPAAVCPLDAWIPDDLLQAIALENNLSETAFFVPEGTGYRLRWFTPATEVDLCGHATLASAFVLFSELGCRQAEIRFETRSGPLAVTRRDDGRLEMDFPAQPPTPGADLGDVAGALGAEPVETWSAPYGLAVFRSADEVRRLRPDFARILELPVRDLIATAPADGDDEADFVSRFFAPGHGIPEDPVTGSAHCILAPYWARRLGRRRLFARQISARGGELWLEDRGDRVAIAGDAVLVLRGEIAV